MLQSGSLQQRPYTAPVYLNLREAASGISNQGWRAWFKGLLPRLAINMFGLGFLYEFVH